MMTEWMPVLQCFDHHLRLEFHQRPTSAVGPHD
jgi:hypothetical protein